MSGITKILTRTPGELGSIKTNKSPIVEENKQLPAEQWNTAADAIIEIQTVIGEAANPGDGTITKVLGDHEERISELEQNGGGGTPDRIESPSGEAFVESTDDFMGAGVPGSAMIAESNGASGLVAAYPGHAGVRAGPEGSYTGGAGFDTSYDPTSDAYTLRAYGAPLEIEEPTESNHAATKGYVDDRPGAEEWSEHAATQDVDLDGHKLTGLGEPTDAADAATKAYVDAQAGGGGGGTPGHVICNAIDDDPYLEPVPQRKNLVFFSDTADVVVQDFEELDTTVVSFTGGIQYPPDIYSQAPDDPNSRTYAQAMVDAFYAEGEGSAAFQIWLADHNGESSQLRFQRNPGGERFELRLGYNPDDLVFEVNDHTSYGDKEFRLLNAPTLIETPTKPMHAATKAYVDSKVASMHAPPDLEWWEPVWTPVENVDSVSNVECSYTRTYRAAGGSLVTLEGTIEVTPEAAGQCAVQVDLPIARDGSGLLAGTAMAMEATPPGHVVAVASVGSTTLTLGFVAEGADPYLVGFRASYRAA